MLGIENDLKYIEKLKGEYNKKYLDKVTEKKYYQFYHKMYNEYFKSNKEAVNKIEKILDKCVSNPLVPDYYNFDLEIFDISKNQNFQNDYRLITTEMGIDMSLSFEMIMFILFIEYTQKLNLKSATQNDYSKWKLLYHHYNDTNNNRLLSLFINFVDTIDVKDLTYDIDELDPYQRLNRLEKAINDNQKNYALELSGSLDNFIYDAGERNYFKGLIHYKDGKYEEALNYLNHKDINEKVIDYKAILDLKLLCYANLGDIKNFKSVYNEITKTNKISAYLLGYAVMKLALNCDINKFDLNLMSDKSLCESNAYLGEYFNTFFNVLLDIYLKIKDYIDAIEVSEGNIKVDDWINDVLGLNNVNALTIGLLSIDDKNREIILKYLDEKKVYEMGIDELRNTITSLVLEFAGKSKDIDSIYGCMMILYRIDNKTSFIEMGLHGVKILIDRAEKEDMQARDLLMLLYIESISENVDSTILNEYIKKIGADKSLSDNVDIEKMKNILSNKGKKALISAEWEYENSKKEDYGWKDAGSISLSFYKIVEIEFNEYISSIFNVCSFDEINDIKVNIENNLSDRRKKQFNDDWDANLRVLKSMYKKKNNIPLNSREVPHLMLGGIRKMMNTIINPNDDFSEFINNKLKESLGNKFSDVDKLFEIMKRYTDNEYVMKYRNPPAHAEYLEYSKACDCRDCVLNIFSNEIYNIIKP